MLSVIWFPAHEHVHILMSLTSCFERSPNAGLGSIGRLPIEIVRGILSHLDIASVFKFRQVNLGAREMVSGLLHYQPIVYLGTNLYRALLRTGIATVKSLLDVYDILCTKECSFCGEFGGYVALLIWKRCCFRCLHERPETQVRCLSWARRSFDMTRAESTTLRSFKSLPGQYWITGHVQARPLSIISVQEAALACGKPVPMPEGLTNSHSRYNWERAVNCMGACVLPFYNKQFERVEHGYYCLGCYMALSQNNWANDEQRLRGEEACGKVHSSESLLRHFCWCKQAQIWWELNKRQPEPATEDDILEEITESDLDMAETEASR